MLKTPLNNADIQCAAMTRTGDGSMQLFNSRSATLLRICFFLYVSNSFTACQQPKPPLAPAATQFDLGTYHWQPMTTPILFTDLDPAYRLVSMLETGGYLVSTATGLSHVVDNAGKVTQLDKSEPDTKTRLFAATSNAVWRVTADKLQHSSSEHEVPLLGNKVRVLWFSARQILLWGDYHRTDGGTGNGVQLYGLDARGMVQVTTKMSLQEIKKHVPTLAGEEKFLAGGVMQQDFWLWVGANNLLLFREESKNAYQVEVRAVLSFATVETMLDIAFVPNIKADAITAPQFVLGIAMGANKRAALHIATSSP